MPSSLSVTTATLAVLPGADANGPPWFAVLRAVVEQVGEDLCEPRAIRFDPHRGRGLGNLESMAGLCDHRTARFSGILNRRRQVHRRALQLHLAGRNPRDVEQVVDQPHHLADLPLHDRARAGDRLGVVFRHAHDVESRADRRQRVAELVGERGEEFVLAAIGLLQRLDRAMPLADVNAESVEHLRLAVGAVGRLAAAFHPDPGAGRMPDPKFDRVVFVLVERLLYDLRDVRAIVWRE